MSLNHDDRLDLTHAVIHLLEEWGLQTKEMVAVLDLPHSVKVRNFNRFRDDTPFPDEPQVMKRIQYLLQIADALRTTYPRSPQMRGRWMKQRNRRLRHRTPLAMILENGENGLSAVLAELDCTYAWDISGSKTLQSSATTH